MKKNLLYIAFLSVALATVGCSDDFLENKKQYGVFDVSSLENEVQAGWYIDRLYFDFYSGYRGPSQNIVALWEDRSALTEEKGGISDLINETKELSSSDDCSQYYGLPPKSSLQANPYTRIRNCNFFISNIDKYGTNVSEEFKNTGKGQCYYLRAIQYFDLVRMYGGVPVTLTIDDPAAENQAIKFPRLTTSECVAQIVSDLDNAASLLPDKWNAANQGRISRAAALALKSRVLLTLASPLFNKDWDNASDSRWDDALAASLKAESELTTAGYGLYGSSAKEWNEMFTMDHGAKFCQEAVFVRLLSPNTSTAENNGWENSIRLKSQGGSGGIKAPKGMVDLFPMSDGSRPTAENGYDELKFFVNRDPRFYRTFAFSGSKWGFKGNVDATIWAYAWKYIKDDKELYAKADQDTHAQAFVRKMTNTQVDNTFQYSGTDIMEFRYAELILNIAECYAAKGDIVNSVKYLSKLRERVGIPSDNNYGLGTPADKYAALEAVLYERRVELAYEGKREHDIKRWMLYNDDAASGNNTCAKLGLTPLNGTCREGKTILYKEIVTESDPVADIRPVVSVDPDSNTFTADIDALADFYENNFILADNETPMDNDGKGNALNIGWRQRYYVWGLHRTPLTSNTWLTQTIGWADANGAQGTFDYQK